MSVLAPIVGPFFLGVALECIGMGIVFMLSINYFTDVANRKHAHKDSSAKLGVIIVSITLVTSSLQTLVDLRRGWVMFADNFGDLRGFLTVSPIFFVSPFLGLFPSTITQGFLLRRVILFMSSLDVLWPALARRSVRYCMVFLGATTILVSTTMGILSAYRVWRSETLIMLAYQGSDTGFETTSTIWLISSSVIDFLLSTALCVELWWARRKLATVGGRMREVVTALILVTLHGGVAVTLLQITALILYRTFTASSYCYLTMLFLPKVYTVTLILSLSLPAARAHPQATSQYSLPTISELGDHPQLPRRGSSPAIIYRGKHVRQTKSEGDEKRAFAMEGRLKRSRTWFAWSLAGDLIQPKLREKTREKQWDSKNRYSKDTDLEDEPNALISPPVPPHDDRRLSLPPLTASSRSFSCSSSLPSAWVSLPDLPTVPSDIHAFGTTPPGALSPSSRSLLKRQASIFTTTDPFSSLSSRKTGNLANITAMLTSDQQSSPGRSKPLPPRPPLSIVMSSPPYFLHTVRNDIGIEEEARSTASRQSNRILSFEDMLGGTDK